ncbi:1,6-anhydro-N-acetylmuramyl-L-alanine amidase AmpD [Niveibacterium terrae]|uniref:1,6-anhydro-N-acetylmuramyl-L-alanine amidase AmpD n=1 Tax=Niveibacterium terrae TaxID=3373598 RepID=UPI003A8EEFF0
MTERVKVRGQAVSLGAAPELYRSDAQGWLSGVRRVPSPNFDSRPEGSVIDLLVVHAISLPPEQFGGPGIEQLFTNTLDPLEHPYYEGIHALRVSSHLLVRRGGEVLQFVPCLERAWHAGVSSFAGKSRCNDFSLGIELEGSDAQPFEAVQYRVLAALITSLARCHPLADVVGHSDVAPGRKTDPGPHFDWAKLVEDLSVLRE